MRHIVTVPLLYPFRGVVQPFFPVRSVFVQLVYLRVQLLLDTTGVANREQRIMQRGLVFNGSVACKKARYPDDTAYWRRGGVGIDRL